ncbi:MAG: aspartate/glutamate racemase family protein [Phycisphaerales bacterium]
MKTIGLLGGMSWESTVPYYQEINRLVNERLGGHHSAKIILHSVDFDEIVQLQHAGDWDAMAEILADVAESLQRAGAQLLVICTNTMHKVAPQIQQRVELPLVHIADATAEAIKPSGIKTVGLLGTRFTMEQDFYKGRLEDRHDLTVIVPEQADREIVHRVIYDELCQGKVLDASRDEYRRIVASIVDRGAQGVILGCSEIGLLIGDRTVSVPTFDTTAIHARAAAEYALA